MAAVKFRGLRFIKLVYPARTLGLGLGFLVLAAALLSLHPSPLLWVVLVYHCFIWPHFAYIIAKYSGDAYRFERLHVLGDAAMGGFWVAAIGFNPLASAVFNMMVWMSIVAAGGVNLLAKGLLSTLSGIVIGVIVLGLHWNLDVSELTIYASIPIMLLFPVFIGCMAYNLAMQLYKQKELLKKLSRMDVLTDIFNRGYWETRAREEIVRVRRNNNPLSLILIDIDHFKHVNDTYGHTMGDRVLQQVAQYLQLNLREGELLGRYGGEEFAIILPDEDSHMAWQLGERLREFIEQVEYHDPSDPSDTKVRCTISVGVAAFSDGAGDFSSWVRAADAALYEAKRMGRNKCISFVSHNSPQQIENA